MTHKELADRRKAIADCIRGGSSLGQAAARFEVSLSMVYTACHANNLLPKSLRKPNWFRVLLDLSKGKSQSEVARCTGVTRQAINDFARRARKAGWQFPSRRKAKQ